MDSGTQKYFGDMTDRLEQTEVRLSKLIESFDQLESDLVLLDENELELYMCLDFHDLYGYLSIDRDRLKYSAEHHDRIVEDYVRILLLHESRRPIVLLPPYYEEFRNYISNKLFVSASSEIRAELSLSRIRRRLKEEIAAPRGLLAYLSEISSGAAAISYERLARLTQRLLGTIEDISPQLQEAQAAALFVKKFDLLVDEERLIGVSRALNLDKAFDVVPDNVLGVSRRRLDEIKPWAAVPNQKDAEALSTLVQINRHSIQRGKAFYLVSNADLLAKVVSELNSRLLDSDDTIQLRDLSFWALWFGFSLRANAGKSSTLSRYTEFRREFRPFLTRLRTQCISLQDVIGEHREQAQGGLSSENVDVRLLHFNLDLEMTLRQLAQPLLDPRWKLEVLTDTLGIVSGESVIDSALSVIRDLLEKIDYGAVDLGEVKAHLERLIVELGSLIGDLEEKVSESLKNLVSKGGAFAGGVLDLCQLRSPYRDLLLRLELEGQVVAERVSLEISRMRAIESDSIEALALDLMTGIYLNEPDELRAKLDNFEQRFPDDWSTIYFRALWEDRRGLLDDALASFTRITEVLSSSRIYFHIGQLYWQKYLKEDSLDELQFAENSLLKALPSYDDASYGVRVSLVTLIRDVRGDERAQILEREISITDLQAMVDRLVRQAVGRDLSSRILERLREIAASLER